MMLFLKLGLRQAQSDKRQAQSDKLNVIGRYQY
ncbi:hypothetical protein CJ739_2600 [Mariniflexile rhizosphaerae]|nr:hypothetical protein CJ739_2600 [Mariniflexile sp. TRM1-10]